MKKSRIALLALALVLAACAAPAQADMFAHPDLHGILNDPTTPKMQGLPEQLKQTVGEEKAEEILDTIPAQLYPVEVAPESGGTGLLNIPVTPDTVDEWGYHVYTLHLMTPPQDSAYTLNVDATIHTNGVAGPPDSYAFPVAAGQSEYLLFFHAGRNQVAAPTDDFQVDVTWTGIGANGDTLFSYEGVAKFSVTY